MTEELTPVVLEPMETISTAMKQTLKKMESTPDAETTIGKSFINCWIAYLGNTES